MQANSKGWYGLGLFALSVALVLACSAFFSPYSYASSNNPLTSVSAWTGTTTDWANVRTGPGTKYTLVSTYAPNTTVTVYATVSGEVVWDGISNWYRVSSLGSNPLYVYGGLVAATSNTSDGGGGNTTGKEILISISRQWMYVYQDGMQVYDSPITTGQAALPTPTGTYHVFAKLHPTTFYSPWAYGSPYWYPPTHINYALEWGAGGFFLHDSWWRSVYGPGTNVWHTDPAYGEQTGTHGCVTMPLTAAIWLYHWAPIGTRVQINW